MIDTNAAGRQPLLAELHTATRTEHTNLNRTIMTRLPLCLPNATTDPTLYTFGMTTFGQIYYGIEEAWDTLLQQSDINEEQQILITKINFPQLRRKKRLSASLERLTARLDHRLRTQSSHLQAATMHFREDITNRIVVKPHLILAYTWTMYLALFNGGRYMAKQFLSAGPTFWGEEDRAAVVQGPLSFWFFGDEETYDGEDLKIAFKEAFGHVSTNLDDVQRDEIVAETKRIFRMCTEMIEFLDQSVQTLAQAQVQPSVQTSSDVTQPAPVTLPTIHVSKSDAQTTPTHSYLAALTPTSVASLWRSLITLLPSSQALPIRIRHELEQKSI